MPDWCKLDEQLAVWSPKLRDDLGISFASSTTLASTMADECRALRSDAIAGLAAGSPVSARERLDELAAFQAWMDLAGQVDSAPITRAQVITQCYICFVYLKDSWFHTLTLIAKPDTAIARCASFLVEHPVRAFRNAFSHGNWRYLPDLAA